MEMRGPPSGGVAWTTKRRRCVDHQATEMNMFFYFFQCAHKNRNNELTNLICLGPALGKRERFLAIAGIASILSFFCLTWRWSNPVFVIVTTRKVSLGGRSLAGGGYQTFGGWNVENSHETWEVVPPGLASSENSICFLLVAVCGIADAVEVYQTKVRLLSIIFELILG